MIRCNLKTVRKYVSKREPFNCNNTLTGKWSFYRPATGMMSNGLAREFGKMFADGVDTFVIKSYNTPIAAWNVNDGWWVSDEKYSPTTSRHQSAIRQA